MRYLVVLVGAGFLAKSPPADHTGDGGGVDAGARRDCAHWGPFSDPTPLPEEIASPAGDPWLSDDGLELLVTVNTGSAGNLDIMRKRRADRSTPFPGQPTPLAVDAMYVDENPFDGRYDADLLVEHGRGRGVVAARGDARLHAVSY